MAVEINQMRALRAGDLQGKRRTPVIHPVQWHTKQKVLCSALGLTPGLWVAFSVEALLAR